MTCIRKEILEINQLISQNTFQTVEFSHSVEIMQIQIPTHFDKNFVKVMYSFYYMYISRVDK